MKKLKLRKGQNVLSPIYGICKTVEIIKTDAGETYKVRPILTHYNCNIIEINQYGQIFNPYIPNDPIVFFESESEMMNHVNDLLNPKTISFEEFLAEYDVDFKRFKENCLPQNQRWKEINNYYRTIQYLKDNDPEKWLAYAFNWEHSLFDFSKIWWTTISERWKNEIKKAKEKGYKITFEIE